MQTSPSVRGLSNIVLRVTAVAIFGVISGCGGGSGDAKCEDFKNQREAQAAFRDGEKQLDADNDGLAC
ncbi:hypothetical protein RCH14_004843, partial [Massilia sp. MP_M2]|uniref:excalibur calcium-binding domain-containing protein n=1 Tax=Massilia sp. MP_M2 TaxID=3071713 RepID=UPI00319DC1AF